MIKSKNYLGTLHSMKNEWRWLMKYIKKYSLFVVIYIVIGLLSTVMALGVSVASKYLIDTVVSHSSEKIVFFVCLVVFLEISKILFQSLTSWITAKVGTRVNNEIRNEIYSHIIDAQWSEIGAFHSGDLINRLEGDVSTVSSGVIGFIPSVFIRSMQFFGSLGVVLYYDKTMALIALLSAPFLFASSRFLIKTVRKYNLQTRDLNGKVLSYSQESIQNIQVIKAFDLTKQYIENFRLLTENYRSVRLSYEKFSILMTLCFSVIGLAVSYGCYGWGVYRLWQNAITFGTMTLFLQISGSLSSSFGSLASLAPGAVSIATSAGRIMAVTCCARELDADAEQAKLMLRQTEKTGVDIIAEDITFAYSDNNIPVLKNVDFHISPGETVALTGPSGEGKTTVLKLLLGLERPQSGRLYLKGGGTELAISDSTRRFCSYVPQGISLFSGTVRENLLLGKKDANDAELEKVLRCADMWDYISSLPRGLDTVLGEHGANISQGQAQRLAIARALLKNSRILLMDEATSALDIETEKRVLDNIMKTDPEKICIITTHRESMLKYCSRIYRINSDGLMVDITR